MMGLGTKRVTQNLVHPTILSKLRRADEVLSDVIVLGALFTFTGGIAAWLIVENPPMVMFEYYREGDVVRLFLIGLVAQTVFFLLIYYLLDQRPVLARVLIFVIATIFFLALGLRGFLVAEINSQKILFGIVGGYSLSVSILALVQAISLAPSPSQRSALR